VGLGVTDLQARLPEPQTAVCHHACHGLRLLNLKSAAETLLDNTENLTRQSWDNSEICCGFGGLFSVKMADVSGAMLQKKLNHNVDSGADCVATGDISCLMHMNGGLEKQGKRAIVRHIADVLADGLREKRK
jgi:L-lactate dehydrogenase complex protein LldE